MPRPRKSAHLYLKPERYDAKGRLTHKATYFIIDGKSQVSTGCGRGDVLEAEKALGEYLKRKHIRDIQTGSYDKEPASTYPVSSCLALYSEFKKPSYENKKKQMDEHLRKMRILNAFWGDYMVGDISPKLIVQFLSTQTESNGNRMMQDLRAAVRHAMTYDAVEKIDINWRNIKDTTRARIGYLTRSQLARVIWHCMKHRAKYTRTEKRSKIGVGQTIKTRRYPRRHLVRFILTAFYTGTRSGRILNTRYKRQDGCGWIDTQNGLYYRSGRGEFVPSNKKADLVPIPDRLLDHMRRWEKEGEEWLITFNGKNIDNTYNAFRKACEEALPEVDLTDINRHALRHSCAVELLRKNVPIDQICMYMSLQPGVLIRNYAKFTKNNFADINRAFSKTRNGKPEVIKPTAPEVVPDASIVALLRSVMIEQLEELDGVPDEVFDMIENCSVDKLSKVRREINKAKKSSDWSAFLAMREAA